MNEVEIEDLIDRILAWTKSPESRNFYRKAISMLGRGRVEEELGELKYRLQISMVKEPAKYFTRLLKQRIEETDPNAEAETGTAKATENDPRRSYISPNLPQLLDELKPATFQIDGESAPGFIDFPFSKNHVPWLTIVGPEFFTLSTNKNRSDTVPARIRTLQGEFRITLVRGKFLPNDPRAYGILNATQARMLGALDYMWNRQNGPRLEDKKGNVICRCTFAIRELAELLGWKREDLGGRDLMHLKSSLANLSEIPYCYHIDAETAASIGLSPETVNISFKLIEGVDFLEKEYRRGETRCEVRFSPQYSRQLLARRVVNRPKEILTIRSELAFLIRQYIEPILMGKPTGVEFSVELSFLIQRLNLPKATWHKHKSQRRQQIEKAIKELREAKTGDGRSIYVRIEKSLNKKDFLLVARLAGVEMAGGVLSYEK